MFGRLAFLLFFIRVICMKNASCLVAADEIDDTGTFSPNSGPKTNLKNERTKDVHSRPETFHRTTPTAADQQGLSYGDFIKRKFQIEGKVSMPKSDPKVPANWHAYTRILVNYGEHVGFVREDGSFVVNNVPPGSYVVEVASKDFIFDPYRVDITSKGMNRLHIKQPAKYFREREQWRITDFLLSPMVLMMIVPFLLILVLPKLMNTDDPEVQREMQQSLQMPKYDMPEISEVMAKWFGGGKKSTKTKAITSKSKRS